MGSYELDNKNYLHYTGDGWVTTKKPLTKKQLKQYHKKELDLISLEWE